MKAGSVNLTVLLPAIVSMAGLAFVSNGSNVTLQCPPAPAVANFIRSAKLTGTCSLASARPQMSMGLPRCKTAWFWKGGAGATPANRAGAQERMRRAAFR